jgi:hypothetical protein
VNGRVEGPIHSSEVVLKSCAHVLGDIQHQSLCVEPGAYFEGRSMHPPRAQCAKSTGHACCETAKGERAQSGTRAGGRVRGLMPKWSPLLSSATESDGLDSHLPAAVATSLGGMRG